MGRAAWVAAACLGCIILVSSPPVRANVFGRDDRVPVESQAYPWNALGILSVPGFTCTATLVSSNLILTAAHCIIDSKTGSLRPGSIFRAGVHENRELKRSEVVGYWIGGRHELTRDESRDWAIGLLKDPIGLELGWMGVDPIPVSVLELSPLNMAGYPLAIRQGETASVQWGCRIHGAAGIKARMDCDTSVGDSGGPVFYLDLEGHPWIVAVVSAMHFSGEGKGIRYTFKRYSDPVANTAVPATDFSGYLRQVMRSHAILPALESPFQMFHH